MSKFDALESVEVEVSPMLTAQMPGHDASYVVVRREANP
jgi:hypothetical protein